MGKRLIIKGADFSENAVVFTEVVTINVNNSSLGTVSGAGSYARGTTVTISATPTGSASFVLWSDGNTNASRQITVNDDITLTAYFTDAVIVNGLHFDGSTYINLHRTLDSRCNFEFDFSTPYDNTGAWLFGSLKNSNGYAFLKVPTIGQYRWTLDSQKEQITDCIFNQRCTLLLKNDGHVYKDSQEIYDLGSVIPSFVTQYNAYLGNVNQNNSPDSSGFIGNIWGFKITSENGTILMYMIPSNYRNTYCFYDVISGNYYMPEAGSLTPIS